MTPHCDRCDVWLQEMLDGNEPDGAVLEHLAGCPACRALYESAVGLRRGLALLPPPEPPASLEDRVVAAVLSDRRRRARRRHFIIRAAALAATVLVVILIAERRAPVPPPPKPVPVVKGPEESGPSLRQTVSLAGSAVADLTARRVDEALETTRLLWPKVEPGSLPTMDMASTLEPTAKPLQTATQGVSAGLEPVAGRARRALALFVRDVPAGGLLSKPGT